MENGRENLTDVYNAPPPANVTSAEDVVKFGKKITGNVEAWWGRQSDKTCAGTVKTYYGVQPLHHLLERSTWHSAQHARQIIVVLERLGVCVDRPLGEKDYAGLPMPAGVWE